MSVAEALEVRGVCYRTGKPTIADYNEAITDLLAAKHQLQSGSLMGCGICGEMEKLLCIVMRNYVEMSRDTQEAATAITDLEALVGELGEAFNDIKQEALTAGSPGCRSSAKAFAHIVRLCIDARATLTKLEKARD